VIRAVSLDRDEVDAASYPFSIPAIGSLTTLDLHPQVTLLAGENGSGKSTLIEAIAVAAGFNPEGGSRNMQYVTHESHSSCTSDCTSSGTHGRLATAGSCAPRASTTSLLPSSSSA
jgi:predicted ATPase